MPKIKKHFESYEAFLDLLYSLGIRFRIIYFRCFGTLLRNRLANKIGQGFSNASFLKSIEDNIFLPDSISDHLDSGEAICIQADADRSLQSIYNLLGSGDVKLDPVDWHADFKTGHRWPPGTFYKDYAQEGIDSDSDVKVPRELSRCHHMLRLGITFRLTKDEKYARLCIDQMENWVKENPLMHSINWGCTMDVAIRAVNWIWTLKLLSGSVSLQDESITRIKISLYEHGWFIFSNPEKSAFNNHNHYLADLSGQIHLGLIFEHLPEPKKWLNEGAREIFREMRTQILPTGMSYERSTNYHRLVVELLLTPILLLKKKEFEIPSDIWFRLEKMFETVMYILKPDGNAPVVGDQDNGRLLQFGCEGIVDFRYLLSLGSILFDRADFKSHGNGYNIYCILLGGPDSKRKFDSLPDNKTILSSVALPDSGFYIIRKDENYLLFNISGKSLYPELPSGTHTHSDLLSFELFTLGKSFLVDPGSFVYSADASQRMLFRSTKMHNTVTIDGESQNTLHREVLWDFERNAIPEVMDWSSNETFDRVSARHTGYMRLQKPVMHQRTICFDKQSIKWTIKDEFSGEGIHLFEWFFHFDAGIDFTINKTEVKTLNLDGKNLLITISGNENIQLKKEKSFVSKAYGTKEESFVLTILIKSECPKGINIEIAPMMSSGTPK